MKNKTKIFIAMLCAAISMLSFNAKAGCPYLNIDGATCISPFGALTFSNGTEHITICTGTELTFLLNYEADCANASLSTDASGGYSGCTFPGASTYVTLSNVGIGGVWYCTFNATGTYQYVLCFTPDIDCQCGAGCITLIIDVIDHLPFTVEGPRNNCVSDNGTSTYTLVTPTGFWSPGPIFNVTWQINGMTGYNITNVTSNWSIVSVDYSSATFDNGYGTAAELCADFMTCCGPQTVCIPIYQCCECWGAPEAAPPGLAITPCKEVNDLSASDLVNITAFSQFITYNNGVYTAAFPSAIIINGTFTVDINFTFEDCHNILMAPEAKILIKSGVALTLSSPQVYHSPNNWLGGATTLTAWYCGVMWDGIYFEDNSAYLFINPNGITNYTIISDARNAIVSENGETFTISYALFENNNKDIIVNNFTGQGPHQGTIEHSILRTGTNPSYPMLPFYTPNTITLNSPLARTNIGIEINNVDEITVGAFGSPSLKNTFDNMDIGILSTNSYLKSRNNWFNNINRITSCPNPFISPCAPEGVGILSKSNTLSLITPALEVGGSTNENHFDDVDDGVYTEGPQDVLVSDNIFTTVKRGVYMTRNYTRTALILNNTIDQFSTGIWTVNNPSCYIEINDNVLNGTYATIQQGTAIKAEEPQQNAQFSSIVKIHGNTIRRIRTGILATNLVNAEINMGTSNFGNDIMFETSHPNTWNASYGIRVQNNDRSYVQDNMVYRCSNSFIFGNPISGCPPGISTASNYVNTTLGIATLVGISMEKSTYCNIINNSTAYLGAGIRDLATTTANTYNCNTMAFCQWMLWLDNSNPGPGQQGTSATSQGNQWRSSNFSTLLADVQGTGTTPANQGPWYVSALTLPDAPQVQQPQPDPIALLSGAGTNNSCSYPAIIGDSPEAKQYQLATLLDWTKKEECTLTEEGKFIAQVEIYKELLYDNSLMNLSTDYDDDLQDFYDDEAETNIGITAQVRYYIDTKDYEEAESINSEITPENQADENEQTTNDIYLDTWAKEIYTYTEEQYESLSDIAMQNPITGGPAVYTARVMLAVDYDDFSQEEEERLAIESSTQENYMRLYPNPAGDEVNIEYFLGASETGIFILSDLTGREVLSQNIGTPSGKITISTKSVESGIYFARIKVNGKVISTEKLVIVK